MMAGAFLGWQIAVLCALRRGAFRALVLKLAAILLADEAPVPRRTASRAPDARELPVRPGAGGRRRGDVVLVAVARSASSVRVLRSSSTFGLAAVHHVRRAARGRACCCGGREVKAARK